MIFALATDSLELFTFSSEDDTVMHAERIDVEDGAWLFFSETGKLLEPVFFTRNEQGQFPNPPGKYYLVKEEGTSINLLDLLPSLSAVQGNPPFNNTESVKQLLIFNSTVAPGGIAQ